MEKDKGKTHGKNQLRPQPRPVSVSLPVPILPRPGRRRALILGDGVEDGLHVAGLGQARGGHGARGGAQLEVDDAVGGKVAEHGEGGVA